MNDKLALGALRSLALDMIDEANSGHPGTSLGGAAILHAIYSRHLVASTSNPNWIKRDRFVMSAGHASALLYAVLYYAGFDIPEGDLRRYKQIKSKTPGHPELGVTPGVDISTGPLGQGIANGVGFAMAERHLVTMYPSLAKELEHYTYVFCGDGCLEEGIGLEAMAIAGLNKLSKLIVCYDNNDVTLDGPLSQSSVDNMKLKAEAMGWNVIEVGNGDEDVDSIDEAITKAKSQDEKPSIIIIKTTIGYGSYLAGNHEVHGKPLGKEKSKLAKEFFGFDHESFYIDDEVKELYKDTFVARGNKAYEEYVNNVNSLSKEDKELLDSILNVDVTSKVKGKIPSFDVGYNNATRNVSEAILNIYADNCNYLFGGSADVEGSAKTALKNQTKFAPNNYQGQSVNFGIREHAMCAIANAVTAHGGLRGYVGSFLAFSDYAKGALRCAALMELPVTYLFSHDSLAVGEDGPTHQPVEQVSSLRLIPNFNVIRPCDANETVGAYNVALSSKSTPTAIITTRQNLKTEEGCSSEKVACGGYVLQAEKDKLDAVIVACGSEVNMAVAAKEILYKEGIDVRVVSMPSTFLFEKQSKEYKDSVLPCREKTVAVEMGKGDIWYKYAKEVMSVDHFGYSGKFEHVLQEFNFNVDELVRRVKEVL